MRRAKGRVAAFAVVRRGSDDSQMTEGQAKLSEKDGEEVKVSWIGVLLETREEREIGICLVLI